MNRKDYQKPTMQVVQLQQQTHLLQASGRGTLGSPVAPDDDEWVDE